GPHALDLTLDYDVFAAAGTGLGCGAVVVLDDDMCPVATSAAVMMYFGRENAAQCGSCFNGTSAMANVLESLRDAGADLAEIDRLKYWSTFLRGRGACGTLDGATNVAASLLREFPDVVDAHLHGTCSTCERGKFPTYPPHGVSYVANDA
ncbi:NADH-ubiquinone oxidoreductase-F iron-sulfur binding region domain-containing protein, partial [Rhodococcus qingshengii]|uniref:NADH-ubiquinone oxidoreductase-F iron-sulfur binding region domain-containing protein n=1 Tax=Rhodococcus qingshengii TaxID=334542 RepID=UPI001C13D165